MRTIQIFANPVVPGLGDSRRFLPGSSSCYLGCLIALSQPLGNTINQRLCKFTLDYPTTIYREDIYYIPVLDEKTTYLSFNWQFLSSPEIWYSGQLLWVKKDKKPYCHVSSQNVLSKWPGCSFLVGNFSMVARSRKWCSWWALDMDVDWTEAE